MDNSTKIAVVIGVNVVLLASAVAYVVTSYGGAERRKVLRLSPSRVEMFMEDARKEGFDDCVHCVTNYRKGCKWVDVWLVRKNGKCKFLEKNHIMIRVSPPSAGRRRRSDCIGGFRQAE